MYMLMAIPTFRNIALGMTCCAFVQYSFVTFQPSLMARSYGMSLAEIGLWLGLLQGIVGTVGTLAGGWLSDRFRGGRPEGRVSLNAIVMFAVTPLFVLACLAPNAALNLALLLAPVAALGFYVPAGYSAVQDCAPPGNRAMAAAATMFVINILGGALGPLLTGALSDLLATSFGKDSLRYALLAQALGLLAGAFFFAQAARVLKADHVAEKSSA